MKRPSLLVVSQRYGDVSGGAEAHARMLVNKLRPHVDVEVATTTARDYWTWRNELTAGTTWVDGIRVHRFAVAKPRARLFRSYERRAFRADHRLADELAFVDAQGPVTPDLAEFLRRHGREFDHVLFFGYLYWTTIVGMPLVPERALLVPTAHDEPAIRLSVYRRVFHLPRAIAYNTHEERAMVHRRFANQRVPNDVVGVGVDAPTPGAPAPPPGVDAPAPGAQAPPPGVDAPASADAGRFRAAYAVEGPFFLYLGRIVQSKGLEALFDLWARWRAQARTPATLVLAGHQEMPIPARADVRYVGQISDADKWDAYAGATAVLVPEALQSLSIVALEAWSMGRPTVCPARSNVLASMSRRASAGVPYRSAAEFAEICELLIERPDVGDRLGASGRAFVARTYTWPAIVEKYLDLLAEVRTRSHLS